MKELKMKVIKSSTRLYVIVARNAPIGVIFRRGPSKQVLLIKWNMEDDTFEIGQWLKARIYERRCDLSPDGEFLLYFAANWRKPYQSWSAVSRPPYFSALALWPKGDGWGGGGQFPRRSSILLNHRENEMALAENFSIPKWMTVAQFGAHSGMGEDDPVWSYRLMRDGWKEVNHPYKIEKEKGAKIWVELDPPLIWQKPHPIKPRDYMLQMSILGVKENDGPWYLIEHTVTGSKGYIGTIGRSEWADWSPTGDLLFSQSGCLYRLSYKDGEFGPIEASNQIADFSDLKFQRCEAPDETCRWPSK
jgi:hypothetical protein